MSKYDEDLKKACEILNNIAEKVAKQPQLTIPKSIAEQADKTDLDTLFERMDEQMYYVESRDIVCISIRQISKNINPQIPEPWASMSADEIIKGLGVYK